MTPIIRSVRQEDFLKMLAIYSYYVEETTISFEEKVPSLSSYSTRLKQMMLNYPVLVAEVEGEIVGYAYAHAFRDFSAYDRVAEITIYLAKETRAKGLGSLLYDELEARLAEQELTKVIACITGNNSRSRGFHEKRGYEFIGEFKQMGYKFNQWLDIVWLEKIL